MTSRYGLYGAKKGLKSRITAFDYCRELIYRALREFLKLF